MRTGVHRGRKKRFFPTGLRRCSWITLTFVETAWQGISHCTNSLQSSHRPQVTSTDWLLGWDSGMLLELFYMLEICCGSGASSRAMTMHMRRAGRGGRSLLIDYMPLEQLLATYPELKPYVEDGSIVYFQAMHASHRCYKATYSCWSRVYSASPGPNLTAITRL